MIGNVQPRLARRTAAEATVSGFVLTCPPCYTGGRGAGPEMQTQDKLADKQLSDEQSREIAETIREELVKRRISRRALPEQARLSLSTLEKVLGGRRPFTLATTVRLEQALGVSLRKAADAPVPVVPVNGDIAPDGLGAYSRRAVAWIEDTYVTIRPSFGDKDAIFAYRTEISWDDTASSLVFHERERQDAAYTQFGEVSVPNDPDRRKTIPE